MKSVINRYSSFLEKFARTEMDAIVIFLGLLILISAFMVAVESVSENNFWLSFLGIIVLPILAMIFVCFTIFPLVFIYKRVTRDLEFNRIIVECLNQIGTVKDSMEFNQVYHLSKGHSICGTDLLKAETLLQKALGSEYRVRIECHHELTQYRIELVRYPELIAPLVNRGENSLIET